MKHKLLFRRFFASLLLLVVSTLSWAYDFESGGIHYNFLKDGSGVRVVGGEASNVITIPSQVTFNSQSYKVTEIYTEAFRNRSDITSVAIGENVKYIYDFAFCNCPNITSIVIPKNVYEIANYAFANCSGLLSVTFAYKSSLTIIGIGAFSGCSALSSIDIPEGVTSIDIIAFDGCSELSDITIPESVVSIGTNAFRNCSSLPVENDIRYADSYLVEAVDKTKSSYTLKEGIRFIGNSAFNGSVINSFVIPEGVISIGEYAFGSCTKLTSVTIPESMRTIGEYAFRYSDKLTKAEFASIESLLKISFYDALSNPLYVAKHLYVNGEEVTDIVIPDNITSIRRYALYNCLSIKSVTLHEGVTSIGESAFYGCSNIKSITCMAESAPTIKSSSFSSLYSTAVLYVPVSSQNTYKTATHWQNFSFILTLEDKEAGIVIKGSCGDDVNFVLSIDSVMNINGTGQMTQMSINPWSYFREGIKSIVISDGVTSICNNAFSYSHNVVSVTIPNSVISIGSISFEGCSNLISVDIGSGVTSIGTSAFKNCSKLKTMVCNSVNVPTTESNAFYGVPQSSATLYVPASSVDAYKAAAQWKKFGTILPIADEPIYIETDVTEKFPTNWSGWNGATGYTSTTYAPKVTTNDGRNVQVCERFNGSSATTGTVFYRTLTGLTNGIYRIELYGAASSTKGRDTGIDSDMTADDEGDETAVYLYATTPSGTVSQYIPVHWATSFSEVATAVLNDVEVTDGTIEIGMYSEKKYTNWHVVQIKGVTAIVDAEERHADVLQTAQWLLAAENYVCVIGEERTALAQTVSQYGTVSEHTAEAYKTAIDAIVAASITFDDARPSYEVWADIVSRSYPYALAEKKAAAENAAAQLPSSAADAESKREVIIPLYRTYAESSTMLEGVDGSEDVTDLYIENPKAETGYSETGWRVTWGGGSPVGSISIKTAEPWTDASGSSDHRYFDGGYWGAQSWDATQQQEVTLPAGRYQLSVMGRSSMDVEQTLFAGENFIDMFHIGASGGLFNRGWELSYLEFELSETTTLNIGVRGVTNYRYNWMSFSDFRLVKFPGETAVESLKAKPETTDSANPIYDLMGRRLQRKPAKGYYIQGGKKYFVK